MRRLSQIERLEERIVLAVDTPPIHSLSVAASPIDVQIAPLDSNTSNDLIALSVAGEVTIALNRGNDTWLNSSTVDLGLGPLNGLATGPLNFDLFPDLIVQGPNGLSVVLGDGDGTFTLGQTVPAAVPGSFAPSGGGRVGISASFLNQDLAVDVATVVPGTDQVLVLLGRGDGTFATPVYYSSGGDEPVATAVGNFIGDASPDIAVGHSDGSVTFLAGQGNGTFQLRNDLTINGLGPITDLVADDFDGDGDADLAVVGGSQATLLLQDADPLSSPPIVNGDFSAGLTGWTTEFVGQQAGARPGSINAQAGFSQFTENESFLTTLKQTFIVPENPETIEIDIVSLGLEAPNGGVPDAFEISLLDALQSSLVPTHRAEATSFFNANPGGTPTLASGASFNGTTVTLDISGLTPGTEATLLFDLVGNPDGTSSVAAIDNVRITPFTVLSETFTALALAGPFTNARGVAAGDVDGNGELDVVISDAGAGQLVVFNGDGTGNYLRSELDTNSYGSGTGAVAIGRLTAGDSADDIAVALSGSSVVVTPLVADFNSPSPTFTSPAPGEVVTEELSELTIQFSEAVQDNGPAGNHSVTNPTAYSLIGAGADGQFGNGDDFVVPIASVSYNATTFEATIAIDAGALPLGDGAYRLTVNGSDADLALLDLAGNPLVAGGDAVLNFSLNTPAQITAASNLTGDEGESLAFTASFADPGFLDSHTATIDWGDGSTSLGIVSEANGFGTVVAEHVYADDGNYAVTLSIADDAGNEVTITRSATVSNVAPTVTPASLPAASADTEFSGIVATFSDPGFGNLALGTQETFTATIDWGDGSTPTAGTVNVIPGSAGVSTTGSISGSHTYATSGDFTITVTLEDDDNGSGTATVSIAVTEGEDETCLPALDFEADALGAALAAGALAGERWADWGIHITTDNPANQPPMIFDSAHPSGDDPDIGTSNQAFGGPGVGAGGGLGQPGQNSLPKKNVLIISEDGNSADPDDDAAGGTLVFTFDQPMMIDDVGLLDIDDNGNRIVLYDAAGVEISSTNLANLGENSYQTVALNATGVSRMEIVFVGSAAVSEVVFCRDELPGQVVAISGPPTATEGGLYSLDLAASSAVASWTINWGDGSPAVTVPGNQTSLGHTFADGASTATIRATARDAAGNVYAAVPLDVAVSNVDPMLTISGAATIAAGATYTLSLASQDPGADTISRWLINWGDGSPLQEVVGNPPSVTHVYGYGPATRTIQAFAYDEDNGGGADFVVSDGKVVVEAEHYSASAKGTGATSKSEWKTVGSGAASGGAYVEAKPNAGKGTGDNLNGPRLDYEVSFTAPGTYYAWVLLRGATGNDDSVHLGLNGQAATLGNLGMTDGSNQWQWEQNVNGRPGDDRVTINVSSAGVHTLNLWMREDGVKVDKIVLSTDPNFTPSGLGPSETPSTAEAYISNTLSVAVTAGTSAALPNINFEAAADGRPLYPGEKIAEQWASLGMHVTTQSPTGHPAMIFDSANPSGGDLDLGTPHADFGGPGVGVGGALGQTGENASPLGNILIVSEDADSSDPDDDAAGGKLIFTFDQLVKLDEVHVLDIDSGEPAGTIKLYNAANQLISTTSIGTVGDNGFKVVTLNALGVQKMEVTLAGSGAVTDVIFDRNGPTLEVVPPATKFFVVDGTADRAHRYGATGTWAGNFGIDVGSAPRGATTSANGDRLWVIQADKYVYVYDTADDTLLGSWKANGLNTVEDITVVGNDVYIVDSGLDKVFKFTGGATLLSGTPSATSSFSLNGSNLNSTGIVSNGNKFWVTDKSADKVFVYNMSGQLQGSWSLDSANGRASGITYDPTSTDLWITDYDDGVIYRYIDALGRISGSQSAGQVVPLAPTNSHPEGIADPVFMVNIGDPPINGAITTPAQVDEYQFAATAGQSIYIDWQLVSGGVTNIRLLAPGGSILLTDSATTPGGLDNGPLTLATAGTYTLEVRGNGTTTPTYRFQLFDVPATVPQAINIGDVVNAGIGVPGEIDAFTFTATAGQTLYFDRQLGSAFLSWNLQSPGGSEVFSPSFANDQGPLVMPATGTYTLRWDGQGDRVEAYRFQIVEVPPTITTPINIGDVVDGAISVQGEVDKYTVNITAGQQLYFNSTIGSPFLGWNLVGPTGTVFADSYSDDQGPLLFTTSGTYTLTVDGEFDRIESYRFQITEVPPTITTPIGYDTVINGAISAPGEVDLYTFNGVAGQQLYFDSQVGSTFLGWNLVSPTGTTLWGDFFTDDQGLVTLPTTGVYTLTVDGTLDRVEAYQFEVWDSTWPPTQPIQLNTTISDFMAPKQQFTYTFTGGVGQQLYFDVSLTESNRVGFTLRDPNGVVVFNNVTVDQFLAPLPLAGTYTLNVAQSNPSDPDSFGNFTFRVQEGFAPGVDNVRDSRGTEFWLAFPPATIQQVLSLYVSAEEATQVLVTIPGINFVAAVDVPAGGLQAISIPSSAIVGDIFGGGNDTIQNRGVHVVSDSEVTVYAVLDGQFSSDAYLGLPVDAVGTEYIVLAYPTGSSFGGRSSQITLVATEDDTTVTIVPSITAAGHPAGVPYDVFLDAGQTYRLVAGSFVGFTELTGTEISSDKPITLLSGHPTAFVPVTVGTGDHIVEQLPSTDTWGRRFLTVPLASRTGGDTFRFLASQDNTTITVNGLVVATLDRGEVHERIIQGQAEVVANNPILVAQYANGSQFDGVVNADPFMMLITPYEQFLSSYTVSTPTLGFDSHFINITVANADVGSITLDGVPLSAGLFAPIGTSGYSGAQIAVPAGDHRLAGGAPFGVYVYGFGEADSYGYPGGTSLAPIALVASVDATPNAATVLVGGQHTVTATVTDTLGNPVVGVRVDFVVAGANPISDYLLTDSFGQVTFVYAGDSVGSDTITVSVGSLSDTVTADWIVATPYIEVTSPDDGAQFTIGASTLITGRAIPGPAQGRIVAVLVNGRPVDTLDVAGNFFVSVPISAGMNTFELEAIDQFGQSGTTTVTLEGVTAGAIAAAAITEDVTLGAELVYARTTFNRSTSTLHAEVRLHNPTAAPLAGPVQAVYSPFRPLSVELANPDGAIPTSEPFVAFDTELPSSGLAAGATSSAIALQFGNSQRARFDFNVSLLARGNRAPTFSSPPSTEAIVDQAYTYQPLASDLDGNPVAFALEDAPAGMVFNTLSGQIEWTPIAAQSGSHQVVVVARDGFGGESRQTFQVRVRDTVANRPPQFTSPPITQIASGADYDYTPSVFDPDLQTLTYTLETAPAGAQFNISSGRVTILSPPDGTFTLAIRVSDGIDSAVQEFVVRVGAGAVNAHVPIFESTPPTEGTVDSLYFYQPVVTDADLGDTLTFSLVDAPAGMQISTATGRITWTPGAAQLGPNPVLLTVSDGNGGVATQSFTIEVVDVPANQAPTIDSLPGLLATENTIYNYTATATDPENATVTFELVAGPAGMDLDENTGALTWTPSPADVGQTFTVEIHAVDPLGLIGVQTFQLAVRATNTAPTFESTPVTIVSVGGEYRYDANAVDAEDGLRYSLFTAPFGMTVSSHSGLVFWNPNQLQLGTHDVVIRATDDRGLFTDQSFTVTVGADTTGPQVTVQVSETVINIGDTVRINVAAFDDVFVSGVTLTINGVEQTLDAQQGVFYTATAAGLPEIIATATDNSGNVGTGRGNLRVIDPLDHDGPLVSIDAPAIGTVVTYLTDVVGSVTAPDLEFYRVEYSPLGANQWTIIAQSDSEVTGGVLGVFDPTMLANDAYDVRVYAQDFSGNVTTEMITLSVEGQAKLGNFRLEFNDLTIPLAGVPITINRIYDTLDANTSGDFGFGWSLGLSTARIRETVRISEAEAAGAPALFGGNPFRTGTRVYLNTPDGRRVGFTFDPIAEPGLLGTVFRPRFTADPGVFEQLEVENIALSQNADGTFGLYLFAGFAYNPSEYTLTTKDQVRYRYDQFDELQDITDRNGNSLTYTDTGIFSSTGESIEFVRDAQGRITEIIDPAGNSLLYEYDAAGNLTSATDQVGDYSTMTYHVDRAHFLDQILDTMACGCGGSTFASRTEYDNAGRAAAIYDALGNPITQTYDLANNTEVIADRMGNETILVFDDRGNVVQEIDPLGDTITRVYDTNDNEIEVTDQRGFTTFFTYDNRGNVTSVTNPLGGVYTTTYNDSNDVTSTTDELGRTSTAAYDAAGNLIELIDADGNSVEFTHDAKGRITSLTDRNGNTTIYVYGTSGNAPESVTHPDGSQQHYEYNHFGQIVSRTDELGHETTIAYDFAGKLLSITDTLGGITTVTYAENLIESVTDPLGHTTTFEYDDAQRLVREIDALGGVTETVYDANGDVIQEIDALGRVTTFDYRADRLLASVIDALGHATTYGYDAVGNRISVVDANNQTTSLAYDELNRVTSTTDVFGGVTSHLYDTVGNILTTTDALGRATSFAYNRLNLLTSTTDPRNAVTQYNYDDHGNLTSVTDPLGNTTQFAYDNRQRLVEQIDPLSNSSFFEYDFAGNLIQSTDRNGKVRTFVYDGLNRLSTETWLDGSTAVRTIGFTYDLANNLLSASDQDSSYTFTYDALNRLLADDNTGTANVSHVVLSYGYDAVGNIITVSDNFGVVVGSTYDTRNLLSSRNWQGGDVDPARIDFTYDARGNRSSINRFADLAGANRIGRTAFVYDDKGRLTDTTHFDALDAVLADYDYEYDMADQLVHRVINGNASDYTYDDAGQLTDADHAAQADEVYAYDANGNRTAGTVIGPNNRLFSDGTFDYAYDAEGNLVTKTQIASGEVTEYSYDYRGRLTRVERRDSVGVLLSEADYTYDVFDRRIAKFVDADGAGVGVAETTRFVYDGDHVWADFDAVGDVTARYLHGDEIDELLARHRPTEGTAWYLTDQLGTVRDIAGTSGAPIDHLEYDSFGNLVSESSVAAGDRFKFTGREFDAETGLYYYRARYYDSTTGRFLAEDPLGFDAGDANLYRYVDNAATNFRDPFGLTAVSEGGATDSNIPKLAPGAARLGCIVQEVMVTVAFAAVGITPDIFDAAGSIVECGFVPGVGGGVDAVDGIGDIARKGGKGSDAASAAKKGSKGKQPDISPKIDSKTKTDDKLKDAIRKGNDDAVDRAARNEQTMRRSQNRRRKQERDFRRGEDINPDGTQ